MSPQEEPSTRTGSAAVPAPARTRTSERLAWAAGGAGVALAIGTVLGSAFAAPAPVAAPAPGAAPAALSGPAVVRAQEDPPRSIPMTAGGMSADSNSRMIAVTGVDITGQSVLFLVDTVDKQLAVYQASGGAPGTQSIKLVGARRIDLDLQLDGFNDKTVSEGRSLTYKDLNARFGERFNGTK